MFAFLHALVAAARLLPFFVPYTDVHLATGSIGYPAVTAVSCWHYIDLVVFSEDAWPYPPDDGALWPPAQLSLPAPKLVLSLPAPAVMLSLPAPVPMLSLPAPPPTLTIDAPKSLWSKPFVVDRNVSCVDGEWTGSLNTALYLAPVCPVSVSGATLTHGSAFNWRSAATALYMVVLALVPHFIGRRLFRGSHCARYPLDRDASDESTDWNQERVAESMGEGESEGEVEESAEGDLGSDSDDSDASELAGQTHGTEQHKAQEEEEEEETEDEEVAEGKEEEVDEEGMVQAEVKEVEEGEEAVENKKDAEETEVEEEEEYGKDVEKDEKAMESGEKNVAQTHEVPEGLGPESPDDQEGWTVVTHHKYRAPRSSQVNTVGGPKGRRKGRKNKDVALTPRQLWECRPRPKVAV